MDDETQHRGHVVTARRRLLKGAVAAPAVLTLYSGSALANESAMRCVVNEVQNPLQGVVPTLTSPSDGLVRVQLWSLRPDATASYDSAQWYVSGEDLDLLASGTASVQNVSFIKTGQWLQYELDPKKRTQVFSPISTTPTWSANEPGVLLHDGPWVAVGFDVQLYAPVIVGVVGSGTGGVPVATSCWSSFATSAY